MTTNSDQEPGPAEHAIFTHVHLTADGRSETATYAAQDCWCQASHKPLEAAPESPKGAPKRLARSGPGEKLVTARALILTVIAGLTIGIALGVALGRGFHIEW